MTCIKFMREVKHVVERGHLGWCVWMARGVLSSSMALPHTEQSYQQNRTESLFMIAIPVMGRRHSLYARASRDRQQLLQQFKP
jgi:hypothetical protein